MIMRRTFLSSLIILSGIFTLINTANAGEVQDVLNETYGLIGETEHFEETILNPAVENYQNYLNQLWNACINGNSYACDEHSVRLERQNQRYDQAIEQLRLRNNSY